MRRRKAEETRTETKNTKAIFAIYCILLDLESFAFVSSGYRRACICYKVLFGFWLFSLRAHFRGHVDGISKSTKVWESLKRTLPEGWLWPVPSAQDPNLDLGISKQMLWYKPTPTRFPSRLLWHVSECRWQCVLSLCWAWCCQGLGLRGTQCVSSSWL